MKDKTILSITMTLLLVAFSATVSPELSVAGEANVINLKFAGLLPPKQMLSVTVDEWAAEVEKRTAGIVKVTTFHAQTLGKFPDFPKMVSGGVCDMAWMMPMSKGFELLGISDLPYLVPTTAAAMEVAKSLYRMGLVSSMYEDKGFKPLFFMPTDPYHIFFRDKKVTELSQIPGLKLRGATPVHLQMMEALKATPVSVSPADLYMALDRQTIDGLITAPQYIESVKLNEVLKYCIWEPMSVSTSVVVMNLKTWNSLPCEAKTVIQDINEEIQYKFIAKQKTNKEYHALMRQLGIDAYEIAPEQMALFKGALETVTQEWVKNAENNGQHGHKLLNEVKRIVDQFK